jgi:hypothetical protein
VPSDNDALPLCSSHFLTFLEFSAMLRPLAMFVVAFLSCISCFAFAAVEITDPAEAEKQPDYLVQGEYVGTGNWQGESSVKVGAQVIALGNGEFHVVLTNGGLPGDGWKRGEPRWMLNGKRCEKQIVLSADKLSGKIDGETMTIAAKEGQTRFTLKKTVRHSPTEGEKAPEDAVVLFDGTTADKFIPGVLLPDGNLLAEETSKQGFVDYQLHLEFRLVYKPEARGQDRSNSGVYLHDCYEVQVLDSFGLEGENNECGGFYQLRKPDVNMCFPPLTWQTYDIKFTAPKYQDGKKVADAKVEVRQNGVVIHPEFALAHATPGRQDEGPSPRPIYLQGHLNKVEYRNIWLKEAK